MRRALVAMGVLVVLQTSMVGVWFLVERSRKHQEKTKPSKAIRSTQTIKKIDRPAPDFRYQLPNGSVKRLSDWKGKSVIVHFWATWCPPCRKELPTLLAFARQKKVTLLAVSVDTSWKEVRRFLGSNISSSIVLARSAEKLAKSYAVKAYPVTYIVDKKGTLTVRLDGARDWRAKPFTNSVLAAMK